MHLRNFIHRDLKPDNIMMGLGEDSSNLFLVDFGLTRSIIDKKTGKHIKLVGGKNLVGTCRYVSVNSHLGHELSRRDDLISVGYIMINFLTGSLPWEGMHSGKPSARYRKVGDFKASISNKALCKKCPIAFLDYMNYVTSMKFEQEPDFAYLKSLLTDLALEEDLDIFYGVFDWSLRLSSKRFNSGSLKDLMSRKN